MGETNTDRAQRSERAERHERDELLLMRHMDGRLSGAETAGLKARLAAEPSLRAMLDALELENDLIAGAVSVPDDVELPEPVMMAIIDKAMKDPKHTAVERRWWKPVSLSLGAAAAVVLAVVSIYMAGNDAPPSALHAKVIAPERNSLVAQMGEGAGATTSLISPDAEILNQTQISTAGGAASVTLQEGITLHLDHNTRLKLVDVRAGHPVVFELRSGALILEFTPPVPSAGGPGTVRGDLAVNSVMVRTVDGTLELSLTSGRVLIQPLGLSANGARAVHSLDAEYLVYLPNGSATAVNPKAATAGSKPAVQALSAGTQLRWPDAKRFSRTVHSDSLVSDLLLGWQSERTHAPGRWWLGANLCYEGLDQAWPVEWASDLVQRDRAPNFLNQVQAAANTLSPEGELLPEPATQLPGASHMELWADMARTLSDKALYDQLDSAHRITWDLLAVKANLMAYKAARRAQNASAAELPLTRLTALLRVLEGQASAKQLENPRLKMAAVWLRMESDLLEERIPRNQAARYKTLISDFPAAVESMALSRRLALLEPVGDARLQQLNLAWQYCHAFQVHLEPALRNNAAAQWRLMQIQTAILGSIAEELYAQGQASKADELIRTLDYLGLALNSEAGANGSGMNGSSTNQGVAGAELWDMSVAQAVTRAEAEQLAGRVDRMEPILSSHFPSALAQVLLRDPDPANPAYPATVATTQRWARCYAAWLEASNQPEALQKFREQAKAFLPAVVPAVEAAHEPNVAP